MTRIKDAFERGIDFAYSLFGERLKGYHTKIFAILTAFVGAWETFTNIVAPALCEGGYLGLCDISGTKYYPIIMLFIGGANYWLRNKTDTPPAPMSQLLRRFKPGYEHEVQKLKRGEVHLKEKK